MNDAQLFLHIDTAFRTIAVLALCFAPFLLPMPARLRRGVQRVRSRMNSPRPTALRSD